MDGQSSALEQNIINCRVETVGDDNVFDGKELVYAPGFNNFYVNAIIDPDIYEICITEAVSSGDIELGDEDFDESNNLTFAYDTVDPDSIVADGLVIISDTEGGGGGGSGNGNGGNGNGGNGNGGNGNGGNGNGGNGNGSGGPEVEDLSIWDVDESVTLPDVGQTASNGLVLNAITSEIGGCKISVEADIVDVQSTVNPDVSTNLIMTGSLSVQ